MVPFLGTLILEIAIQFAIDFIYSLGVITAVAAACAALGRVCVVCVCQLFPSEWIFSDVQSAFCMSSK